MLRYRLFVLFQKEPAVVSLQAVPAWRICLLIRWTSARCLSFIHFQKQCYQQAAAGFFFFSLKALLLSEIFWQVASLGANDKYSMWWLMWDGLLALTHSTHSLCRSIAASDSPSLFLLCMITYIASFAVGGKVFPSSQILLHVARNILSEIQRKGSRFLILFFLMKGSKV